MAKRRAEQLLIPGVEPAPPPPPPPPVDPARSAAARLLRMGGIRAVRQEAAEAATDHADRVVDGWRERAVSMVGQYAQAVAPKPFLVEDARAWAEAQGLPDPPDKRAWGTIPQSAVRAGLIENNGNFLPAKDGSPKSLWRAK